LEAREGDVIETRGGVFFDVKGLVHPPSRVIAFIRYFPNEKGGRKKDGKAYGKVYSLSERYTLLKKRFPQYLVYDPVFDETLCEVPKSDIQRRYQPSEKLRELRGSKRLDPVENKVLRLTQLLKEEAGIPDDAMGISGSIMVGLHTTHSDIDPIVYGAKNCRKVHSALERMLKKGHAQIKPYKLEELKALFDFRSKDTVVSFESFVRTESRKVLQGKFMGTDYFIRYVKDWDEIQENYGDIQYKNVGHCKIEARVVCDSEAIFTPCVYRVEDAKLLDGSQCEPIEEIASFRGRFCEQARTGETVIAQGKVEHVNDRRTGREYLRLLLGNKPSDCMILKD
jgi:predicted nucleotidyltransferase